MDPTQNRQFLYSDPMGINFSAEYSAGSNECEPLSSSTTAPDTPSSTSPPTPPSTSPPSAPLHEPRPAFPDGHPLLFPIDLDYIRELRRSRRAPWSPLQAKALPPPQTPPYPPPQTPPPTQTPPPMSAENNKRKRPKLEVGAGDSCDKIADEQLNPSATRLKFAVLAKDIDEHGEELERREVVKKVEDIIYAYTTACIRRQQLPTT